MRAPNAVVRALAVGAIVVAAVTGGAQAASAHDSLVATSPADGASVSSLSEVTLDFSANLLGYDGGNIVIVLGPDGRHYETDCVGLAGPTLTVPVALGAPGTYTVEWRAVSSDGHPVSGTFAFTSTGASTSAGSSDSPCASAADATEAPSTEPSSNGAAMPGLALGLLVGGGAVVVVGVVVFVILGRRTREE
ncbi:copper resistance CopC family protein [Microbacterium trichothecenolyticum]|uniref:Methionine-rich copper-binding protein CopC n=1 Tax=Microbacterium trichothecenolyticum TaxID=69370 RepID=A0ABU0TVW4_MICTR|nr:copper resistance CopC family protein [Microbacterium trichothecenolyticum]MDQ1123804.1 methionine-rich copper-binding protein CopC [Microbacterium trichothecenolyticum]